MEDKKIAILIDAENISYKNATQILETMSAKGDVIVKEIIADWSKIVKSRMSGSTDNKLRYRERQIDGWRKEASSHSMTAVQQFSYISGKNTSDMALTIQAMKILYEKPFVTSFCLVSNDSDFTRLAQELRENNKEVVGMGERSKAIPEFVNAFSEFVYLGEEIEQEAETEQTETAIVVEEKPIKIVKTPTKVSQNRNNKVPNCILPAEQMEYIKMTIDDILDEHDGIAFYSLIAIRMKKQYPDFVPANYECKSISVLIDKIMPFLPMFMQYKEQVPNNPSAYIMMLKRKK